MKVYTTAPIGTEINLNLENRNRAAADYPIGRRCVLQAKTTKTRAWEELEFRLILRPDPGTLDGTIDQLVMLVAPNTNTSDVYFFDDFVLEEKPCKNSTNSLSNLNQEKQHVKVYPNPFTNALTIDAPFEPTLLTLFDMQGKAVLSAENANELNTNIPAVIPGMYWLQISNVHQHIRVKLIKVN